MNATPARADAATARQRLLDAALRLFAEQGYDKTSTREIAEAAEVNLGGIAYYFGDKASLYRAVFSQMCGPIGGENATAPQDIWACVAAPEADLATVFRLFYADFLKPLKQGERTRQLMRLHFREMVEPSGALLQPIADDIRPLHLGLTERLARHLNASPDDADVQRLALAVAGIAVHHFVGQDFIADMRPHLVNTPEAIDELADRLHLYALGMVEAEARRRAAAGEQQG